MLEQTVLAALIQKDAWLRFGGLFDVPFFASDTYRKVYKYVRDTWRDYEGEATTIPKAILFAAFESGAATSAEEETLKRTTTLIYEVELDHGMHVGLVRDALLRWRARDYIVSAATDLEAGSLDLFATATKFDLLARATEKEQEEEPSPIHDVLALLSTEMGLNAYTTGLVRLDDVLNGGLWAQELGVIIAQTHGGKTWFLTHMGASNLALGTPVQHFTHEISRQRVAIRYYQNLLKKDRLYILSHPEAVKEELQSLDVAPWSIKDYASGGVTTATLRKDVRDFVEKVDTKPLIMVDYIDLIQPADRRLEGRFALTAVTEELRQIAAEFEVGVWTATQANRPSWSKTHIRMQDVSEAIGKVEKADVIVTLNQNPEEKRLGEMRFFVDKARERVVKEKEVAALSSSETQSFSDLTDGFANGIR